MKMNTDRTIDIMGIVNITDDSFFSDSRCLSRDGSFDEAAFEARIRRMVEEGASILDFGACSTRPGSDSVDEETEWARLEPALKIAARELPGTRFSVDTFRPEIASRAYDILGPFIVNDVSGGCSRMWQLVADLGLPYVAMHTRGTPKDMQKLTEYENVTDAVHSFFERIAMEAQEYGVENWILDPGFGFAKTVEQNWQLLREMAGLMDFGKKILVGLSRKSFLYKPLGLQPKDVLQATQIADFVALQNGADILRVHDIAPAVQTVRAYQMLQQS
jgi:dihydropteroate synthase